MSGFEPRFDTFNNSHRLYLANDSSLSFHPFYRLPAELRLRIWKMLLRQPRLVTVNVQRDMKRKLKTSISGYHYRFSLSRCYQLSPLLMTSHEARQAALEHYRVRIPSIARDDSSKHLYLSPEYDYVFIRVDKPLGITFMDFLNDVTAYDPQKKGVLNLAITGNDAFLSQIQSLALGQLPDATVALFRQTLFNVRNLWAVHLLSDANRLMLGVLSGTTNCSTRFNRSVPIFSEATDLKIFDVDPRPFESDLGRTTVGRDPRTVIRQWQALRDRFGLGDEGSSEAQSILNLSYVLAIGPENGNKPVYGPKTMDKYLTREREQWASWEKRLPALSELPWRKELLSVAGFWIFPSTTFDELQDAPGNKRIANLQGHRPALAIFEF